MPRITLQGCSTQRNGDGRDEYDLCEVFTRHFKYISLFLLFFTFRSSIIRVSPLLCSPCALVVLSTQLSVLRANKSVFPIWLQSRRDKCSQNKKFSRNSWTIKHPSPLSLSLSFSVLQYWSTFMINATDDLGRPFCSVLDLRTVYAIYFLCQIQTW